MAADRADALVIFGATGDLARLETFPALVGLVERGVLDVPVIGVANSGWGLDQFRNYAEESLRLNNIYPSSPAAATMLGLLKYIDGDLGDDATYAAIANEVGERWLFARQDTVEAAWRVVDGILGDAVSLYTYPEHSWGPKEADTLVPDGEPWHDPVAS
jgi:glucose-6-phosphate 1-dehydrogenase